MKNEEGEGEGEEGKVKEEGEEEGPWKELDFYDADSPEVLLFIGCSRGQFLGSVYYM